MKKIAYGILAILAVLWIGTIFVGMVAALPYGLPGLFALIAIGILFIKALTDRLNNEEDDYYSKNIHQ